MNLFSAACGERCVCSATVVIVSAISLRTEYPVWFVFGGKQHVATTVAESSIRGFLL